MMSNGSTKKEVQKKTGVSVALWDINMKIPRGQIFVIIGLSGSGKSTLVRCFNQLNKPTYGHILFEGKDLADLSKKELLTFRREKISMVFQSFGLMSTGTCSAMWLMGWRLKASQKRSGKKRPWKLSLW